MRLAALQRCRPLLGMQLIESWRARAAAYPGKLMAALIDQALNADALTGWGAQEALASRRYDLVIHDLLAEPNARWSARSWRSIASTCQIQLIKWQRDLAGQLTVVPERLEERLQLLWASNSAQALETAEVLLAETALLAEASTDADLSSFRAALSARRPVIEPSRSDLKPA